MELKKFSEWLDKLLQPQSFKDYCVDGLCVEASDKVTKVITGVSFRDKLIEHAIKEKADTIIVHHPNGFWKNDSKIPIGHFGMQIRLLMQNGISLFGYHLPLDGHIEIGNNAVIANKLNLKITQRFMKEGESFVGQIGEWDSPLSQTDFCKKVNEVFYNGIQNQFFFGTDFIKKVAVCSGSGASGIDEAIELGCDAFLTGEIKENIPIKIEESHFNLVSCGHHRTEIFGVQALAEKIQNELGIEAKFIDIDNPI